MTCQNFELQPSTDLIIVCMITHAFIQLNNSVAPCIFFDRHSEEVTPRRNCSETAEVCFQKCWFFHHGFMTSV